jgi:ABC-type Mn2+/Zn2+ transport system ATPase subunit
VGANGTAAYAVRLRGATFTYGSHVALTLREVTLPRGAITAVIGPNGSGKSTLLGGISGLVRPAAGSVEVNGDRPRTARSSIAYVLQETALSEAIPITVREVIQMGRYARRGAFRPPRSEDRAAVAAAMDRLGIADLALRHLRELSGGQRQRVYVAQGLSQEADVLLLDEPATGLDLPTQERIGRVMVEERDAGRTVVFTTHDVSAAADADHVVLLARREVACGPPGDVLTTEHLSEAYGGHVHVADGRIVVLADVHEHPHTFLPGEHPHG